MYNLQHELFHYFHESVIGGHSVIHVTRHRMVSLVYWKRMATDVKRWVRECTVCQRCKYDSTAYSGLLQPLPIPRKARSTISMDFIEGLPFSKGKDSILVEVDRLTKYDHFVALYYPFSTLSMAQAYLDNIYNLHGLPESIVSNRDNFY